MEGLGAVEGLVDELHVPISFGNITFLDEVMRVVKERDHGVSRGHGSEPIAWVVKCTSDVSACGEGEMVNVLLGRWCHIRTKVALHCRILIRKGR